MTCAAVVPDLAIAWPAPALPRGARAVRYAGVLAVWLCLALIRPRLAWSIYVHRRPDSPLRRRR